MNPQRANWTAGQTPEALPLRFLTRHVRVLSALQVSQISGLAVRPAVAQLQRLSDQGLVDLQHVVVHPEIDLSAPIIEWEPDDAIPDFEKASWTLRARWRSEPASILVATATRQGCIRCGGVMGGRPLRRNEIRHDLHVSALFLRLRKERPDLARLWIHEDALGLARGRNLSRKRPDALIGDLAVDFGGSYRAAKLRDMHFGYAEEERAYQVW